VKVLVVEDDRRIKAETIDDCLASLGHESDWAQHQQEANGLLAANDYDLILLDLQIPSRAGGKDLPEFGKNLLRQIHERKGRGAVPVILMTGYHQQCVDLLTDLQEIGVDGSISKPFPTSGRTLARVIEEVMAKHRRFRLAAAAKVEEGALVPFEGGVLAYHPKRIDLCGETIAEESRRGLAWGILQALREKNRHGKPVHLGSHALGRMLDAKPAQNTLIRSVCNLRSRIAKTVQRRLGRSCGQNDVIDNDDQGYFLRDWIVVEVYDEVGTLAGQAAKAGVAKAAAESALRLCEKQRWVMARLAAEGKVTRREVEEQFGVSIRTAKRIIGELVEAGLIEFDRSEHPGCYRLT